MTTLNKTRYINGFGQNLLKSAKIIIGGNVVSEIVTKIKHKNIKPSNCLICKKCNDELSVSAMQQLYGTTHEYVVCEKTGNYYNCLINGQIIDTITDEYFELIMRLSK